MIYLPDVNIWIALASDSHVHHAAATSWLRNVQTERIAFCRITELGFLRLLTNRHVMQDDVLGIGEAWDFYHKLLGDPRIEFLAEPRGFDLEWLAAGRNAVSSSNMWTDAYLAIFARYVQAQLVTFDMSLRPVQGLKVIRLP